MNQESSIAIRMRVVEKLIGECEDPECGCRKDVGNFFVVIDFVDGGNNRLVELVSRVFGPYETPQIAEERGRSLCDEFHKKLHEREKKEEQKIKARQQTDPIVFAGDFRVH